jgi:hypothetical protein
LAGGRDDTRLGPREGTPMPLPAPEPSVVRAFVEAVRALSYDPQAENIERYLLASNALEESRLKSTPRMRRAA